MVALRHPADCGKVALGAHLGGAEHRLVNADLAEQARKRRFYGSSPAGPTIGDTKKVAAAKSA
jgi:hypothetical protein